MKVLVVAPQPFFSPRGTPFSVYYRTLVTSELGHQADVLTYGQGTDVDIPNARLIRIPTFSFLGSVRTGPSMLKLFLDVLMMFWTAGLLLRHRYDVVHAHEEAVFWCRWFKPLFRFKLVYDMHSSLPQQLHNFQYTRVRAIHWLFEKLETSAVRAADVVIAICPSLEAYARGLRSDHTRILLIENSIFDPIRFAGSAVAAAGNPHGRSAEADPQTEAWLARRPASQTVAYAGTLEAYQGIGTLLEAFALASRENAEAGLLVIGGLPAEVHTYREVAKRLGLHEQVYFTGQRPQAQAQHLVMRCGAAISPRFSGNNTPLKIYHLMASGVPLIATRIESHTQVLTDDIATLTGVSVQELAEGILTVLRSPDDARCKAKRARQRYDVSYSRDVYTGKMERLFELMS
jgi:glycosyltransferase involved in cell wall biosynthesis